MSPLITKYIPLASIREIVQDYDAQEKRLRAAASRLGLDAQRLLKFALPP